MWKPFASKSQNSSPKKIINYHELFDIIDFWYNHEKSQKDEHRKDYDKYRIKPQTSENDYKPADIILDPHLSRIQHKVKELDLEDNIRILGGGEKVIKEAGYVFPFVYEIEIRDLQINVARNLEVFLKYWHADSIVVDEKNPWKSQSDKKAGLLITFKNNHFMKAIEERNEFLQTGNGEGLYLCFEGNKFIGVDIYMTGDSNERSVIELKNNVFDNRHVTISQSSYQRLTASTFSSGGSLVDGRRLTKQKNAAYMESRVNAEALKKINDEDYKFTLKNIFHLLFGESKLLRVSGDDVTEEKSNSYVFLDGNKFTTLLAGGSVYYFLRGKNMIEKLEPTTPHYIYFSPYEEIDKEGNYPDYNRRTLIKFHEEAVKRNDLSQIKILHLEIRKCEHKELRKMPWLSVAFQDKIIMEFSYHMSRYSTSWFRPLAWLLGVNLALTILLCFLNSSIFYNGSFGAVFWNFFNPITYLPTILGVEQNGILVAIDVFQKALLALLGFEIMKAFRHLTTKS